VILLSSHTAHKGQVPVVSIPIAKDHRAAFVATSSATPFLLPGMSNCSLVPVWGFNNLLMIDVLSTREIEHVFLLTTHMWAFSNQMYKNVHAGAHAMPITRAFKMGWNPQVNSAHHGFGSVWVEIFL